MSAQVAADLRAAAEVLRRDGWCQLTAHRFWGQHCAAGAIEVAVDPHWKDSAGWEDDQNARFSRATYALQDYIGASPTFWNDAPDRTADEVIAALEAAADAAEATP